MDDGYIFIGLCWSYGVLCVQGEYFISVTQGIAEIGWTQMVKVLMLKDTEFKLVWQTLTVFCE
jgi:hypothetical protein